MPYQKKKLLYRDRNGAFAIVGHVAGQPKAVSVAEIANALSLPVPTAHRLVGNLEERGLLQKALGTKRYVVGNHLVTLSAKVIGASFRTARRHAVLREVANEIGEQCEIVVVRDDVVTYVDSVSVIQPLGLQFKPGETAPLHCTSTGKIYMSRLPPRQREKLVEAISMTKYTENTITDRGRFMGVLEETRRRGWAKSNEEYVKGVVGCAVPIVSPDRELIACLGVSVPVARVSFAELDGFIVPLKKAAELLSQTILQTDSESEAMEEIQ
jgi:DNA-binding IclR family transcriptional regulator